MKCYKFSARKDISPVVGEITQEDFDARQETLPTQAELAATLSLPASDFWLALNLKLIEKGSLALEDDVQDHVLATINAAVTALQLSATDGLAARILVKTAITFHRADPDRPGLMDAIGALIGLTAGEIDALFVETARAGAAS